MKSVNSFLSMFKIQHFDIDQSGSSKQRVEGNYESSCHRLFNGNQTLRGVQVGCKYQKSESLGSIAPYTSRKGY